MKVLLLYDYPASPGGLATQGSLLYKGLLELGVDVHAVHYESDWKRSGIIGGLSRTWQLALAIGATHRI